MHRLRLVLSLTAGLLPACVGHTRTSPDAASPSLESPLPIRARFSVNSPYLSGCVHASLVRSRNTVIVSLDSARLAATPLARQATNLMLAPILLRQILPDSVQPNWEIAVNTANPIRLSVLPGAASEAWLPASTVVLPVPDYDAASDYWPALVVRNGPDWNFSQGDVTVSGAERRTNVSARAATLATDHCNPR